MKTSRKELWRAAIGSVLAFVAWNPGAWATSSSFNYTGSIETWTVPTTGLYHITAYGAQGGSGAYGQSGGYGDEIGGDFNLTGGGLQKGGTHGETSI